MHGQHHVCRTGSYYYLLLSTDVAGEIIDPFIFFSFQILIIDIISPWVYMSSFPRLVNRRPNPRQISILKLCFQLMNLR